MHVDRESDRLVVPEKRANKACLTAGLKYCDTHRRKGEPTVKTKNSLNGDEHVAEFVEERSLAKRNVDHPPLAPDTELDTRGSGLDRVRKVAQQDKKTQFTALLHHITPALLLLSFYKLNHKAAVGVDEETWKEYEKGVRNRIKDLHARVHQGTYRAKPSKRIYLLKPDGRQRPIGIACLEDKIVQHATGKVLAAIYEEDFKGFSYGFRPKRKPHDALDALYVALMRQKVNWVLDADIRGFRRRVRPRHRFRRHHHRIADRRILRLIRKWLTAGISEEGEWSRTTVGTPQGAVISPLLANVFLHYALDLWIDQWRKRHARGNVIVIRYADDFVMGFQYQEDAERCHEALRERLGSFGLELHPDKTRLLEFGRFAASNRKRRGQGKPETFDFLGFTHYCGRRRSGSFVVNRKTIAKRLRAKLQVVKKKLRSRINAGVPNQGAWLRSVVQGWFNYHAVPGNRHALNEFRTQVSHYWRKLLQRRSHKARNKWPWARMKRLLQRWIPSVRILHPYPDDRFFAVTT